MHHRNRIFRAPLLVLVSVWTLALTGCPFRKKPPVPQPNTQAPTISQPQPVPTPTATPTPTPTPPPAPASETAETTPKPKPKRHRKPVQGASSTPQKPEPPPKPEEQPQQQASAKPPRIVIQEGSAAAPQGDITAPIAHDEATHRRLSTAQLLQSTEDNLRGLKPPFNADEQATVAQIRDYMEQARSANAQNDLVRAHNLALKAHLLSDELAKK